MSVAVADFDGLRERFNGELVLPNNSSYERRSLFNALHDKRPAVIALCEVRRTC